jgi:hypothetical protein
MFFQVFKDDILELLSSLIEKVNDIPGILCDWFSKMENMGQNYMASQMQMFYLLNLFIWYYV